MHNLVIKRILRRSFVIEVQIRDLLRDIPEPTKTAQIYADVPLWDLSWKARGQVLEEWAKQQDPSASEAYDTTKCINGSFRGAARSSYDYMSDGGKRIEVKSSALLWDKSHQYWVLHFRGIKPTNDEVRLVTYLPCGLYLHKWNHAFACGSGIKESIHGHNICITASRRDSTWKEAANSILQKDWGTKITMMTWEEFHNHVVIPSNQTVQVFTHAPFANLTQDALARFLAEWVRNLDSNTTNPEQSLCRNYRKRSSHMSEYNYLRTH
jgi:hypothetical protein